MYSYTGGCQCGAVRFRLNGKPKDVSICHCRMCQKAFGNYFAPFASCHPADVEWTRGAPKHFASSNFVTRGFCADCGTPLTYEAPDGLSLAAGAFDDPAALPPTVQYGIEGKLPFTDHLARLPGHRTEFDIESAPFLTDIVSNQHPDTDTPFWRGPLSQPGDE
ncbi:GFA family protein [Rhizobium paknamense]|uniref:GFA family protein n=1 Tax=Rhizobium paknamense TaxID=1206817 RepID=UPI0027D90BB3|nr:GFA family protein [Rhizobium paknamense]